MKALSIEKMEMVNGGGSPTKYDWINGLSCGATLALVFTPATPLAILTGNVCAVGLIGYSLNKY